MATDPWYVRELVADIPEDEWQAAVETEDWDNDEGCGEDGDESEESEEMADDEDGSYEDETESSEEEDMSEDGSGSFLEGSRDVMESEVDSESSADSECTATLPTVTGTAHTS